MEHIHLHVFLLECLFKDSMSVMQQLTRIHSPVTYFQPYFPSSQILPNKLYLLFHIFLIQGVR